MKYALWVVCVVLIIIGFSASYSISSTIKNARARSSIISYDLESERIARHTMETFDLLLHTSEMAYTMDTFDLNKDQFSEISDISSKRKEIEITVYSEKVYRDDRLSFETNTSGIYNRSISILHPNLTKLPYDDDSEFYWPIKYEYFPNDFPGSIVGLDLYALDLQNTIELSTLNSTTHISNPVLFIDTGELGLLVLEPLRDDTAIIVSGVRPEILIPVGTEDAVKSLSISNDNGVNFHLFYGAEYQQNECKIVNVATGSILSICFSPLESEKISILIVILGTLISVTLSFLIVFIVFNINSKDSKTMHSRFISCISHEIKTPLNGITCLIDILKDQCDSIVFSDYVDVMKKCSSSLVSMINNLLYVSLLQDENVKIEITESDIISTIHDSVMSVIVTKQTVPINLLVENSTPMNAMLGDHGKVKHIISNIVSNSIKFTETGSISITVKSYKTTPETYLINIEVKDTGIGIPESYTKIMFKPFVKVHQLKQTYKDYGGSGLGLVICDKLIKLMGGIISCKSTVGTGTTFSISFNMKLNTNDTIKYHEKTEYDLDGDSIHGNDFELSGNALIVDDNLVNRMVLEKILKKNGISSILCEDGKEAVTLCSDVKYSLILMDVFMPIMDGIEASKVIRKSGRNINTPIVFVSATTDPNMTTKCLSIDNTQFIGKPVNEKIIISKIKSILKNKIKQVLGSTTAV